MNDSVSQELYLPGQPIFAASDGGKEAGDGTYLAQGFVRASLVGAVKFDAKAVSISKVRWQPPKPGSVVLGSITRLFPLQAMLSITIVDGIPLPYGEEFTGVIRTQDIRATEKDKVKIHECFRGGDVVKGIVLSLGDSRSYFISTARNDLGVIFATSEAGATMDPVSWQEMRCPQTGKFEKRKCAKPDGL